MNTRELYKDPNKKTLYITVQLFALCVLAFLCFNYFESRYFFLTALPLSFLALNFVFKDLFEHPRLINCIILGFCLIKYSLSPLFLVMTNNSTVFSNTIEDLKTATGLMCFELFLMYFFIFLFYHRKIETLQGQASEGNDSFNQKPSLDLVLIIAIVFVAFVFLFIPESKTMFKSILSFREETFTWDNTYEASANYTGTKRIVLTLFTLLFKSIRIIVPLYCVIVIARTKMKKTTKLLLSFVLSFIQFWFITSTIAEAFIAFLITVYFITCLYPEIRRVVAVFSIGFIVIVITAMLIYRFSLQRSIYYSSSVSEYLSKILSSYFPGVNSVAASLNVKPDDRVKLFLSTYSYSIPFNTTLFGEARVSYATLFNLTANTSGQIPSTLGMGCTFLPDVVAPVFSAMFGVFGVCFNELSCRKKNLLSRAVLFVIGFSFATATGVYNSQIALSYVLNTGVVLALLTLSGRKRFLWKQ